MSNLSWREVIRVRDYKTTNAALRYDLMRRDGWAGQFAVLRFQFPVRLRWNQRKLSVDSIGGPTRAANAGRGAGALDALLGWKLLCGEVSEQSATYAGAGERVACVTSGGRGEFASAGGRGGRGRRVAGAAHAGVEYSARGEHNSLSGRTAIRVTLRGESAGWPSVRLSSGGYAGASAEPGNVCGDSGDRQVDWE